MVSRKTDKDEPILIESVRLSHPEKELFAGSHLTKADIAKYYCQVGKRMLAEVGYRPLNLLRCPAGSGRCFFQRHLRTEGTRGPELPTVDTGEEQPYTYVSEIKHLVALIQLNVLEIHPWGSRIDSLEYPDRMIFDLDPAPDVSERRVIRAGFFLRDLLAGFKLRSFPRVTGGKGLHLVVPLSPVHTWDEVKDFSFRVASSLATEDPQHFIAAATKVKRTGKIFVDYLRNGRGASAIANYSTRNRPEAIVAVPLRWKDLENRNRLPRFDVTKAAAHARGRAPWPRSLGQKLPK